MLVKDAMAVYEKARPNCGRLCVALGADPRTRREAIQQREELESELESALERLGPGICHWTLWNGHNSPYEESQPKNVRVGLPIY